MQVLFVLLATIVPFSLTELSFLFRQIHYEVVGLHAYSPNSILLDVDFSSHKISHSIPDVDLHGRMLICSTEVPTSHVI